MINYRKYSEYQGSVFSFGAGVQSTAILLLLKHEPEKILKTVGPLPEHIIFADTGAEKLSSLENLEKCRRLMPIYRVKNWKRNAETSKNDVPAFFVKNGMALQRKCTSDWKIKPIKQAIRKIYKSKKPIALWLGISTDEITRMKESWVKKIENVYPLIEMGLSRQDCYKILAKYDWKVAKSSCYMCPFQREWGDYKGEEKELIIKYETDMQETSNYRETPYLHRSAKPIKDVIEGQNNQLNLFSFEDECEGYCGL